MDKEIYMAIFQRDNKILLGLRKYDEDTIVWTLPGGKAENGETMTEGIQREVHEETGLSPELITVDKVVYEKSAVAGEGLVHYVKCKYKHEIFTQELELEGGKFLEWKWFDINTLPVNMIDEEDKKILPQIF